MRKPCWAVLISGRGSNLTSLLDLKAEGEIEIGVVVSSSASAGGLWRARRAGVANVITPLIEGTRRIDWLKLTALLRAHGVTNVCLAGFMKIVPRSFVLDWQDRLINLHPSLLPAYPGLESIERAFADRSEIGVTVHFVNEEVDAGKQILQRRCLKKAEISRYSLGLAEFIVHVTEQRVLRSAVRMFNRSNIRNA